MISNLKTYFLLRWFCLNWWSLCSLTPPRGLQLYCGLLSFEQQTHPVQIKRISCFGLVLPLLGNDVRSVKSVFASGLQAAPPLHPWDLHQRHILVQAVHHSPWLGYQVQSGLQPLLVLQRRHRQSLPRPQPQTYCHRPRRESPVSSLIVAINLSTSEVMITPVGCFVALVLYWCVGDCTVTTMVPLKLPQATEWSSESGTHADV